MAKVARPFPNAEIGGREVLQRRADNGDQVIGEPGGVIRDNLALFRPQLEQNFEIVANQRSGVGVRRVEYQMRAVDAVLLLDARGNDVGDAARQADEVGRDDHDARAVAIFDGQRLGPEIVERAFGRMIAAGVTGHVDGLLGRNDDAADAGFVIGGGER